MEQRTLWRGEFEQIAFRFEGREAIVVLPHKENRNGKWLLKTEYFAAFQELEHHFVQKGYALAYVANRDRWAAQVDIEVKERFCEHVVHTYGLEKKCIPIGMSCGGMIAIKFAARYPDRVRALYLDAPVVNLLSFPCGLGEKSTPQPVDIAIAMRELDIPDMAAMLAYREHPLDVLPTILQHRIPAALVCGSEDQLVPFEENGAWVRKIYIQSDVPFFFLLKQGCGHHPHGPGAEQLDAVYRFLDDI